MNNEFRLVSYQVNVFPIVPLLANINRVLTGLLNLNMFTGKQSVATLEGSNLPPGVSIISLSSADGLQTCDVSSDKLSLTWLINDSRKSVKSTEINVMLETVSAAVLLEGDRLFKRIGFITTIGKDLIAGPESAQSLLSKRGSRLQLPDQSNVARFVYNASYKTVLNAHAESLSVLTIGSANLSLPPHTDIFAIQQDINTQPNEDNRFTVDFIKEYVNEAITVSTVEKMVKIVWD